MSAEKELELLKAQVQDIARVCKVSKQRARAAALTHRLSPLATSRRRSSSPSRARR
jgi:hypothetical protein